MDFKMLYKILISVVFYNNSFAIELLVEPYLQNATPNSIFILWETDSDSPSIVEWGISPFLTEITMGSSFSNFEN